MSRSLLAVAALFAALVAVPAVVHALNTDNPNTQAGHYVVPAAMAPKIPVNVALSGGASAGTTLALTGQCVRISCSVDCQYRVSQGASTAVSTDNDLPAQTPERICLPQGYDTVTFFSASAGTAKVAQAFP